MNYIELINAFWIVQEEHSLTTTDIALYFNLLKICNVSRWVNPFKRNTAKILADLCISRPTLDRSRNRLKQAGLIDFKSVNGSPNVTYTIIDLSKNFTANDTGSDKGHDTGSDKGSDELNKDLKRNLKIIVVEYAQALDFFLRTKNFQALAEKFGGGAREPVVDNFKIFYEDKVDLGEFNNKTPSDLVRHFSRWLPIFLQATGVKSKKVDQQNNTVESKTDAALRRHNELLIEFENGK